MSKMRGEKKKGQAERIEEKRCEGERRGEGAIMQGKDTNERR